MIDNKIVFLSKEQLIKQLKKDKACIEGIILCNTRIKKNDKKEPINLQQIFELCPYKYRIWCIARGYCQFLDNLDFSSIKSIDALYILIYQPDYFDYFKNYLSKNHLKYLTDKYQYLEQ